MNTAVSILIPVYNVEKYIERCARSLFEQSSQNLEYIFVNDCTPDKSIEVLKRVLEEYPERKEQVRIINHEKNMGLAVARITGILAAKGQFITHVDSDDWLSKNYICELYNTAIQNKADLVVCSLVFSDGKIHKKEVLNISNKTEYLKSIIRRDSHCRLVGYLIDRELVIQNKCWAPMGINMGEDYCTTPRLIYLSKKIVYNDKALYYYFKDNISSYSHNVSLKSLQDRFDGEELLMDFFSKKDLDFVDDIMYGRINNLYRQIASAILINRNYKKIINFLSNKIPIKYLNKDISRRKKIVLSLCKKKAFIRLKILAISYKIMKKCNCIRVTR